MNKSYILKFKEANAEEIHNHLKSSGAIIEYESPILPIIAFNGDTNVYEAVSNTIQYDYLLEAPVGSFMEEGSFLSNLKPLQIVPKVEHSLLRSAGYTGWGITVAVLDSGISEEWVKDRYDFTGYGSDPVVDHGDKVANIIKRFSRGSKIISCKIGQGYDEIRSIDVMKAIDFAVKEANIINLSLGFEIESCRAGEGCPVCEVVNYYVAHNGVTFVTAAGNNGEEGGILCPGRAAEAITVGSVENSSEVAEYSSKGNVGFNKPNILTSGLIYYNQIQDEGTSFSAPVVTGVMSALVSDPGITSVMAKNYLYSTAKKIDDAPEHHQGFGVMDLRNLLEVCNHDKNNLESTGQEQSE